MSDFLNQFSKEEDTPKNDNKNAIKPPEHKIEIDHDYYKKRNLKIIIIAVTLIALLFTTIYLFSLSSRVKIINFINKDLEEIKIWALKNDVELDITYEFSLKYSSDKIIKQSIEKGKYVSKKTVIDILVSKGPDENELIQIPDFNALTYEDVTNWISDKKLFNTYVLFEYDTNIEKNKFIKYELNEEGIDTSNFKRKNNLTIYFSKGKEQNPVTLIDFVGKTKTDVETFLKTNELNVKYVETESSTVAEGLIISQSIKAGETVNKENTLIITISIGKLISIPNYINTFKDNAASLNQDVTLKIKTAYSYTISYGNLISQSIKSGTKIKKDIATVELIYSEGKPFIDDLRGKIEKEIPNYFYELTSKGASVSYTTVYVDSSLTKGEIIYTSKMNEYLEYGANVVIHISKGNL